MNVRKIFWEAYNRAYYDQCLAHDHAIEVALDAVERAVS